jgi:ferritin-like metal-binding protein YciE
MSTSDQKVLQYLNEARAMELSLVRVLQSQMAMTPHGSYRDGLERHLDETRDHAERVGIRLEELGHRGDPLTAAVGVVETVIGQALAIGKAPFDMLRGSGGEEKVLKNAKDAYATEALEIATYTALERLARSVGDDTTAQLARSIRVDEERMLARVLREIPKLTDAVVGADVKGESSFSDEPWVGYDELTAAEVIAVLSEGDDDRAKDVRSYERAHKDRAGVLKAAERELTNA